LNPTISRAVILARGLGTRMRRANSDSPLSTDQAKAADTGIKGMIPVGRPFMDYLLSALADAGFTDVCLVIGPEHESVRAYASTLSARRIRVTVAVQPEPRGTADAVGAAETFAGADGFLVLNSDNYYPVDVLRQVRSLPGPGLAAFLARAMIEEAGVPPERVAGFPRVEVDPDGVLTRLRTDRPARPDDYVSMNCWRFESLIFDACRSITPSPRGELELPDAVQYSIGRLGARYRVIHSDLPVLDLSTRADIARVTRQLAGVTVSL
jgi:dTDP-glucose pyrophosphorylase